MSTADPRAGPAAGWFGKIPAVGDFVSRRLPESFRVPWDRWLEAALVAGAERHGPQWDELYLTFPIWRFLAPRGLLGDETWVGILLPSVDRVGRHYPLTVAETASSITAAGGLAAIERRLALLAAVIDPVLDGASVEQFEAMLNQAAADPAPMAAAPAAAPAAAALGAAAPAAAALGAAAPAAAAQGAPAQGPPAQAAAAQAAAAQAATPTPVIEAGFAQLTDQLLASALGPRLLWWLAPSDDGSLVSRLLPLEPMSFVSLVADDA